MRSRTITLFIVIAVQGLSYCSNPRVNSAKNEHLSPEISSYFNKPILPSDQIEKETDILTLRQALALALMKNPALKAFSWEIRAREAKILQAGLYPNPELGVDAENVLGSDELSGFSGSEITIWISQPIKLGGQLSKGERVAAYEHDLAGWDYQTKRIDVFTVVTKAYIDVLAAQKRLELTKELSLLSEKLFKTVSERVKAGKVSPIERIKAKIAFSSAKIELEHTTHELKNYKSRLTATWGNAFPLFKKATGKLDSFRASPSPKQLVHFISKNPDVARWTVEIERRRAIVELAKGKAIPDLKIKGGMRFFNDTGNKAFTLGLSILLPIFDRNQGKISETKYLLLKTQTERRAKSLQVLVSLIQTYQRVSGIFEEATTLKNEILPSAKKLFYSVRKGYRYGKFPYTELLNAQRTLFKAKSQYLEILTNYHKAVTDLERLIGRRLDEIGKTQIEE